MPLENQVLDILREMQNSSGEVKEVVFSGDLASQELINRIKPEISATVRLWKPENDLKGLGLKTGENGLAPGFADAVGAAIQELVKVGKPLGVTDRIPLTNKVKERVHLAPVLCLVFVIICFAGHFVLLKTRISGLEKRLKTLNEDKRIYTELKNKRTGMLERQTEISRKSDYLNHQLPIRQQNLLSFLNHVPGIIPNTMVVKQITQAGQNQFRITGHGLKASHIGAFAGSLSELESILSVEIETIEKGLESDEKITFPYDFSIKLTLKG